MKLSVKLSISIGTLILVTALSNVFSIYQLENVNRASTELAKQWIPSIVAIEEMNTITSDYRIAEIQHAMATSEAEMREYESQQAAYSERLEKLRTEFEKYSQDDNEKNCTRNISNYAKNMFAFTDR